MPTAAEFLESAPSAEDFLTAPHPDKPLAETFLGVDLPEAPPPENPATTQAVKATAFQSAAARARALLEQSGANYSPEESFKPEEHPVAEQITTGAVTGLGSLVPRSVGQAAKMVFYTPVEETPHALKEAYDVITGKPIEQAVPESQRYIGLTDKPLSESAQIVTEDLAKLGLGVVGLKSSLRPHPTGEPNASQIRSTAEVPVREVREGVGGQAPLQQPREAPAVQQEAPVPPQAETILEQPKQGGEISEQAQKTRGETPEGTQPTGAVSQHGALEESLSQGQAEAGRSGDRRLRDQEPAALSGEGEQQPPPAPTSPVVSDEPHVSSIANRFVQERAARGEVGPIVPGEGALTADLVQEGLKMPPEEINQHVSDLMHNTGDIVKQGQAVRAEEARLQQRSNQLSKVAEAEPNNVEAKLAADNAFNDLTDFHNGPVAALKQKWHATGMEMQGEIPVDLGTFNGLREQWLRDTGENPPPRVESDLRRAAKNVAKSVEEENGARSRLAQEIDKAATKGKYPTADEVRNNIRERMGLEPCKT